MFHRSSGLVLLLTNTQLRGCAGSYFSQSLFFLSLISPNWIEFLSFEHRKIFCTPVYPLLVGSLMHKLFYPLIVTFCWVGLIKRPVMALVFFINSCHTYGCFLLMLIFMVDASRLFKKTSLKCVKRKTVSVRRIYTVF